MSVLDYEKQEPRYVPRPEDRRWRLRRIAYYLGHVVLFGAIVYRAGPNMFLFHSPFSPPPQHYAGLAKQYMPLVAAIKAYQRDFGKLPMDSFNLPPRYRPAGYTAGEGAILGTNSITFGPIEYSVIEYNFAQPGEGWTVYAPRYKGPIPAPLVLATPSPASRPTTGSSDDTK
jgi:hypothetical protein